MKDEALELGFKELQGINKPMGHNDLTNLLSLQLLTILR